MEQSGSDSRALLSAALCAGRIVELSTPLSRFCHLPPARLLGLYFLCRHLKEAALSLLCNIPTSRKALPPPSLNSDSIASSMVVCVFKAFKLSAQLNPIS